MAEKLSNQLVLKELNDEIKELSEELKELETAISSLDVVKKQLTKNYSIKKVYLEKLEEKKFVIEAMDESYGSEKLDDKNELIANKIEAAESFLESTKDAKKSIMVKMQRNKTLKTIERLNTKKGKIAARQKKIVDKTLASEIKKISKAKETKNQIVDNYYGFKIAHAQNKIEKYVEKKDEYTEQIENASKLSEKIVPTISKLGTNVPMFASRAEAKMLEKTLNFIKFKNCKIEGLRQLPSNLSLKLREKISQGMHNIADSMSRTK